MQLKDLYNEDCEPCDGGLNCKQINENEDQCKKCDCFYCSFRKCKNQIDTIVN
jgi:hypothetical protein